MGTKDKGKVGARKLSRDVIAEVFGRHKSSISLGVVVRADGESSHYDKYDDDIMVDVRLVPENVIVLCRLAGSFGGDGRSMLAIPPENTEVVVAIPHGETDADPIIIGCLAAAVPSEINETSATVEAPFVYIKGIGKRIEVGNVAVNIGGESGFRPLPYGDTFRDKINEIVTQLNLIIAYVNGIAPGTATPITLQGTGVALGDSALSDDVYIT